MGRDTLENTAKRLAKKIDWFLASNIIRNPFHPLAIHCKKHKKVLDK